MTPPACGQQGALPTTNPSTKRTPSCTLRRTTGASTSRHSGTSRTARRYSSTTAGPTSSKTTTRRSTFASERTTAPAIVSQASEETITQGQGLVGVGVDRAGEPGREATSRTPESKVLLDRPPYQPPPRQMCLGRIHVGQLWTTSCAQRRTYSVIPVEGRRHCTMGEGRGGRRSVIRRTKTKRLRSHEGG